MAINYTRSAQKAKALIEANGRTVTLIRKSKIATDPTRPWEGNRGTDPDNPKDIEVGEVKAVVYPINHRDVDGVNVRRGDEAMWIAHDSLDPAEDLKDIGYVQDGNIKYKVMNAEKLQPGDVIIAYQFQLRQ